jgi:hypothetical protein
MASRIGTARAAMAGAGALAAALLLSACHTGQPPPLASSAINSARQFDFFRVYWAGRHFDRVPVTQLDGLATYNPQQGSGVYYGDCEKGKGILGTGACTLPLEIQTTGYTSPHSNKDLGPQWNVVIRGVPAAVYDHGDAIELYTGLVAIDVFGDSPERALAAVDALTPLNAPPSGPPGSWLPAPRIQPGLYGPGAHVALDVAIARGAISVPVPKPAPLSAAPPSLHGLADLGGPANGTANS